MEKIIYVDPKDITKLSPVSGCANSRKIKAKDLKCYWQSGILYGDWDLTKRTLKNSLTPKDYKLFMKNENFVYPWGKLIYSMLDGYIQDPDTRYIEVSLGRNGELLLVDGRHRLFLAQKLNIKSIPVKILDVHPEYNDKVIPKFLYNMIARKWDKKIKVYHHWGTINHRYNLSKKYLPLLKGLDVVEVGPNSGMLMWSIMKYANSLCEIELQEKYFKQCEITRNCLELDEVYLLHQSFEATNFKNISFNAFFGSFVLYHLSNKELDILKNDVLPKCKVVIIPNRTKERNKKKNSYSLNRNAEIRKLLDSAGFKVTVDNSFEKGYSIVVGTK